jgi:hypothetical protein
MPEVHIAESNPMFVEHANPKLDKYLLALMWHCQIFPFRMIKIELKCREISNMDEFMTDVDRYFWWFIV